MKEKPNNTGQRQKTRITQSPYLWCFTTYFAEGFPYTIIRTVSGVFFRDMKVSLEAIGLTSLYGLPWTLKFLWGPQVDEFSTKRSWMLVMQALIAALILVAALFAPLPNGIQMIGVLFFIGAVLAATHDIAIDGFYLQALDKAGQARFVGWRVMAYRLAMMTGTGVIVTLGTRLNWSLALLTAAILFGLVLTYHYFFLPRIESPQRPAKELVRKALKPKILLILAAFAISIWALRYVLESTTLQELQKSHPLWKQVNFPNAISFILLVVLVAFGLFRQRIQALLQRQTGSFYAHAFVDFMDQKKIGTILAFVIFLRTGEFMLSSMVSPFIVDVGIKMHYGWISSLVGLPCSVIGAIVGGSLLAKFGMRRLLWPFLLAQNFTNLIYMFLALALQGFIQINTNAAEPVFIGYRNLALVGAVHGFDQFAGGLGSAVLTIYLMRICKQQFKAAHFAIGSGLMSISGVFAGIAGGYIASWLGYWVLFGISFLAAIPGMALAFFVPRDET